MSDLNEVWVNESPKYLTEGSTPTYTITYAKASSVTATAATMAIYKNAGGSDLASTLLTGSISADGNVLTLKKISGLVGGNFYIISVGATVDGAWEVRKLKLVVQKAKQDQ